VRISVGLFLVLVVLLVVVLVLQSQCPKLFTKREDDVDGTLMIPLDDEFADFQAFGHKSIRTGYRG
jgi:hypothetical protein